MKQPILKTFFLLILAGILGAAPIFAQPGKKKNKTPQETPKDERRIADLYVEACGEMMLDQPAKALELFQQVLQLDPAHHASMYNIAKLSVEQKDYNTAIQYAGSAVKLDPQNYWYYVTLEEAYELKGDLPNAISIQESVVTAFPEMTEAQALLSDLYSKDLQPDKALKWLNKVLESSGPNEDIYLQKYRLLMDGNKTEEALDIARALVALNPNEPGYAQMLYETNMFLGRSDEARQTLENLLKTDPSNSFALLTLADYYRAENQPEKSDAYLFRAFENPDIDLPGKLGIIHNMMAVAGRNPELIPRIEKLSDILFRIHPATAETYSLKGDLFSIDDMPDSAALYYKRSLDLNPVSDETWTQYLFSLFRTGDFKLLQAEAEEALSFYPNQREFLYYFGIASARLDDHKEAIYAFEKIKKIGSTDDAMLADVYLELGAIYHFTKAFAQSDENFEEALSLAPDNDMALNNYAYYLSLRKEKLEKARKMAQKALDIRPGNANYEDTFGWVLYQLGEYKEAEKHLRLAVDKNPNAEVLEHYGDVLFKLGRKTEATQYWERAIAAGALHFKLEDKMSGQP
jgi:tetratricopeptide (TPR) repeat protein